mmetsp:Transcript_6081/g.10324  ORF Transcript_6081/g.10324 Transcript_6081/m.10324 type:complete len:203 (+) Transcript_6081:2787-3395(+)
MKHPNLYRIGLENQCFGVKKFFQYILYALLHALIIYFLCMSALSSPTQSQGHSGKDLGFWVCGHVVYGTCVMVANITIMHKFNNFTGWGEGLAFGMVLCFYTSLFGQSLFSQFPLVFHIFDTTYTQLAVWMAILLCCLQVSLGEMLMSRLEKFGITQGPGSQQYLHEDSEEEGFERDNEQSGSKAILIASSSKRANKDALSS